MVPYTRQSFVAALMLSLLATGCGGASDAITDTITGPTPPVGNANPVQGQWTGTQTTVAATTGTHCANQLVSNLIAANRLSESLQFQVIVFESIIRITPSVGGTPGGSYEGTLNGEQFSASFKGSSGALSQPTFCQNANFYFVERGGAMTGRVASGLMTGSGTREFSITDSNLRELSRMTATYQFSVRK